MAVVCSPLKRHETRKEKFRYLLGTDSVRTVCLIDCLVVLDMQSSAFLGRCCAVAGDVFFLSFCWFLCPSRYRAAVSLLCLSACMYSDGVLVRRLLCSALLPSFTAVGTGMLHGVRRLAWRVADTDTCHRKGLYPMCCAEVVEIRAASNNLHCFRQQKVHTEAKPFHVKINGKSMEIDVGPPPRTESAGLLRSLQPCISTLNRRGAPRGKTYERRHCSRKHRTIVPPFRITILYIRHTCEITR
jgi:hypothetical protein